MFEASGSSGTRITGDSEDSAGQTEDEKHGSPEATNERMAKCRAPSDCGRAAVHRLELGVLRRETVRQQSDQKNCEFKLRIEPHILELKEIRLGQERLGHVGSEPGLHEKTEYMYSGKADRKGNRRTALMYTLCTFFPLP